MTETRRPRDPTPDKRATEEEEHRNQEEKTTRREDLDGTRRMRETEGDRRQDAHRHAKDPTNRKRVVRTHRELTRSKGRTPSRRKPEIRPSQKRRKLSLGRGNRDTKE